MRYRALVGLTLPINEAETRRILLAKERGKPLSQDERKTVRIEAGDIVPYIPSQSIYWLLEQSLIEEVV